MKRKRYTRNQRAEIFEQHNGTCWRCGLPIDPVKEDWHVGHVGIPHALGGEQVAPEHAHCNLQDAYEVVIPTVAKCNRIRANRLLKKEPKIRVSRRFDGTARRWNPETRKWEDYQPGAPTWDR